MPEAQNQFVVDLGNIKLSADQTKRLNASIQRAVASELSIIAPEKSNLVFLPIGGRRGGGLGPIINGIIIRQLKEASFKNLVNNKI